MRTRCWILHFVQNDKQGGSSAAQRRIQQRIRMRTSYWILHFVQNDKSTGPASLRLPLDVLARFANLGQILVCLTPHFEQPLVRCRRRAPITSRNLRAGTADERECTIRMT